jgi:hypothetical protein
MITIAQYFQAKPHSAAQEVAAYDLLKRVDSLLTCLNYTVPNCPNTGTAISGSKGGSGDGGFRLDTSTTGADHSSHKEGRGVDLYDPLNKLDTLLTDSLLTQFGLYREAAASTPFWTHLTTRSPASGHRTFIP